MVWAFDGSEYPTFTLRVKFFIISWRSPSPTESAFEDARSEPDDQIQVVNPDPELDSIRIRKEIYQQATDAINFSAKP